jgi:hypothetical protein
MLFRLLLVFAALSVATISHAEDRITAWAGIDLATNSNGISTQHGIVLIAWERDELPHNARLHLALNTDTIIADYGGHQIADNATFGLRFRGELHFGNLLPDFYASGEKLDEFGVSASFLELAVRSKWNPADHQFLTFEMAFQPWFLRRADGLIGSGTNPDLVVPDPVFLFRPHVDYAYWNPGNDPSNWEQHRPFPRTDGVAFGVSAGLDIRNQDDRWGFLEGEDAGSSPVLDRNDPDTLAWYTRGWYRWGVVPHDAIRIQGSGKLGYGDGGDDITRTQIGGQNQYVVRIPGAPWGAFLSESYAQSDAEFRWRIADKHEIGVGGSIAGVPDPHRLNDFDEWAAIPSAYLLFDFRFSGWQLDARAAWASDKGWSDFGQHFGVFVSLGKTWTLGKD